MLGLVVVIDYMFAGGIDIPNNHVKLHFPNLLWFDGVDELIGVGFHALALFAAVLAFRRAAEGALAVGPAVGRVLKAHITLYVVEPRHGIDAVRIFGAIEAPAREQAGQLRDGDAVELMVEDVVRPCLQIGNLCLQPDQQPLGDFPQKHAALARGIEERRVRVAEQLLRQHVQHGVRHLWRREHLVVAQIRNAGQHIGIIDGVEQIVSHDSAPSNSRRGHIP